MKKTVSINLGGMPFIIDEDAYDYLRNYLGTIEAHFATSEGCSDIVTDIEYRITELLQERLHDNQIVSMKDIDYIVGIMGKPEDFGAEPMEESEAHAYNQSDEPLIKTGKKLYRDKDNGMLGGVIAGLAAYFGIKNPLILRVIWALISIPGGIGIAAYVVLWIFVPEAHSASEKLAMKGEPINVENIAKTIEEEIDDLSKKINDLSDGLSRKKRNKKRSSSKFDKGYTF